MEVLQGLDNQIQFKPSRKREREREMGGVKALKSRQEYTGDH